jgi:hypothetical protein
MVNSDDQFRPIRKTQSDDTKYPIGRGEVIPHLAIQQSIELCTGRYENAKFHISRQAITRAATEHDLIRPGTRVHPPQFVPYAPGVLSIQLIIAEHLRSTALCLEDRWPTCSLDVFVTRHISLWMDSPEDPK